MAEDANLLRGESSPYLLQHADNPVHWRPWGAEALAEAKAASEAFLTSASSYVLPVTRIDDMSIGNGRAGSVTMALAERYHAHIRGDTV